MNNEESQKLDILYKLRKLHEQDIKSRTYYIDSNLEDMQYEYEYQLYKKRIEQDKIDKIYNKYNLLNINLKEWLEQVNNNDFNELQGLLNQKYKLEDQNEFNRNIITLVVILGISIYTYINKEKIIPSGSFNLNNSNKLFDLKSLNELIGKPKDYIQEFINGEINIYHFCKNLKLTIKTTDEEREDCILCYSNDENQIITKCNHNYCISCLLILMKQDQTKDSCAYCKQKINLNECTISIKDERTDNNNHNGDGTC